MKFVLLAALVTFLTVVIHSLGTYQAIAICTRWSRWNVRYQWMRMVGSMAFLVIFLLMVHLTEAGVWALVYYWWRALPDLPTSVYYSLTSYSTVGFGDVVLPESSRILGPIESVVGVLMLGWSTAVIVAMVQKLYRDPAQAANPT